MPNPTTPIDWTLLEAIATAFADTGNMPGNPFIAHSTTQDLMAISIVAESLGLCATTAVESATQRGEGLAGAVARIVGLACTTGAVYGYEYAQRTRKEVPA